MKLRNVLFFLLLLFFFSCVKEFNVDIDAKPKITVYGLLIPGRPVVIGVSYAPPIDSIEIYETFPLISNAYVEISDDYGNKDVLDTTKNYDIWENIPLHSVFMMLYDYVYYSDSFNIEAGKKYYLKVYVPGYDTIYSATEVPKIPPLIDTFVYHHEEYYSFFASLKIINSDEDNFYWIIAEQLYTEDPAAIAKFTGGAVLINTKAINKEYVFNFNFHIYDYFDSIGRIFIYRANNDFFNYIQTYNNQIPPEIINPYAEPTVVYNNIENGVGLFAALSQPVIIEAYYNTKKEK